MKKFKWIAYILLIIIIVALTFTIYTSIAKNNEPDLKEKSLAEIKFIESKLLNLFNAMNNIEFENYNISTSKMTTDSGGQSGESSSSDSDTGESSSSSGGGRAEAVKVRAVKAEAADGSSSSGGGSSSSSSSVSKDNKKFDLKSTGVLTNHDDINWDNVKSEIETIYTTLPTITLDLYQLNLNQDDVSKFNKEFDNLTTSARNEDKEKTLDELTKVYEYMPKFVQNATENEMEKTILNTKLNIFKAYSKLDSKNWEEISNDIKNAADSYSGLLTNTNIDSSKQYNINKSYVMLNELKNAISLEDEAVFLIKYKNLLEELSIL